MKSDVLKQAVYNYWNAASCGTECTQQQKFSPEYFKEIEDFRYRIEPEIFSFAQFTRFHGAKVLEVGVGAGTDFMQWVRAGALAHGIDLTQEAITNVTHRLALESLRAHDLRVADAEHLPYADNFFDLTYSWGVIHHSPNMEACLAEIIRVSRPGGTIKVMIYNRHSLYALYKYLICGVKKGKFFASISDILFHQQESLGTKAYTIKEVKKMLMNYPVKLVQLKATVSSHDLLYYKSWPYRTVASCAASILGRDRVGWFMTMELKKLQ